MADQIVSWGGFNSKGTSGMGVTGSLAVSGSATITNGATVYNNIQINTSNTPSLSLYDSLQDYSWLVYTNGTNFFIRDNGGNNAFSITPNRNITTGPGTSDAARLTVKGSGTTSSTTSFLVQNSAGTAALTVKDNLSSTFGGVITGSGVTLGAASSNQPILIANGYFVGSGAIATSNSNGRSFNTIIGGQNSGFVSGYNGIAQGISMTNEYFVATGNINLTDGGIDLRGFSFDPTVVSETGATIKAFSSTLSAASNRFNLHLAGTAKNYIAGNVGIGTSTPSASLHISGSSNSALFEIDSPSQNNILYVSGSGRVGIGKVTDYALEVANTSSLLVSATGWVPTVSSTASAAVSITPNIFATAGNRSYYSLYVANPGITISGSFGNYDFRSLYTAGKIDAVGGINAGDSRFYATSNAVSFQGYNPYDGNTGDAAGGITFTSRQVAGGDEAGIGAYYGAGSRLYIYNKYNASDSKIIFSIGGTIRSSFFGTGNLSIGNGETDMSARLGVKGSGTTNSTTSFLAQNSGGTERLRIYDDGFIRLGTSTLYLNGAGSSGYFAPTGDSSCITQVNAQINFQSSLQAKSGVMFQFGDSLNTGYITDLYGDTDVVRIFRGFKNPNTTWNYTDLKIDPTYQGIGASCLVRGIYYNPTNSLTGTYTIRAIETTTGSVIFNGGNVGIGTSTPSASLHVTGSTLITGSLTFNGSDLSTAWTSYTPTWTSDGTAPSLGNGTLTGAYKVIGKTCFVRVRLAYGSSTTSGTGAFYFDLPFSASAASGVQFPCSILDNGNAWYQATVNGEYGGFTNKTAIIGQSSGANSSQGITGTFPFTFGTSDSIQFNGSYEIA